MPLIPLPVVLQRAGHDCADGVYGSVTQFLEERRRKMKTHPWYGGHPLDLEPHFRRAGYHTFSGQMTLGVLRAVTALWVPVCCLIQLGTFGHWVAVRGVTDKRVHFMDPASGHRWLTLAEWEAGWYDRDHHGTEYRNHGLAVWC